MDATQILINNAIITYHKNIYPYILVIKYLETCGTSIQHRDILFQKIKQNNETYVTRFESFTNTTEFYKILQNNVMRIEIGGMSTTPLILKNITQFSCVIETSELKFDVDIDLYDTNSKTRDCCIGGTICPKCITLGIIAIQTLIAMLKIIFNFKSFLISYSGNKGFHLYVCDPSVLYLSNDQRKSIVHMLCCDNDPESMNMFETMYLSSIPFRNVVDTVLVPYFFTTYHVCHIEAYNKNIYNALMDCASKNIIPKDIFIIQQLEIQYDIDIWLSSSSELKQCIIAAIAKTIRPKIDSQVTTSVSHLLKSMYTVHGSTQRICIPLSEENLQSFALCDIPYLTETTIENGEVFEKSITYLENWIEEYKEKYKK